MCRHQACHEVVSRLVSLTRTFPANAAKHDLHNMKQMQAIQCLPFKSWRLWMHRMFAPTASQQYHIKCAEELMNMRASPAAARVWILGPVVSVATASSALIFAVCEESHGMGIESKLE
jgi:hypothetical protein